MALHFEWTPELSVDDETIDGQHRRLLAQLNTLIDAMVEGPSSTAVADALHFFELYVQEHFAYEEEYMREHQYAELEHHKEYHRSFQAMYGHFKEQLSSGVPDSDVLVKMEEFLGEWWIQHIGNEDQKYKISIADI